MSAEPIGVYRERARSAVLVAVTFDPATAAHLADQLSCSGAGPHLVAPGMVDVIRYNDPTAPRYLSRHGDWDSRSTWQPYPAPR